MHNAFMLRSSILGTNRLLQASPHATHVAAAGRALFRPAAAALYRCAEASKHASHQQQPRTIERSTTSTNSTGGPAAAESTVTQIIPASAYGESDSVPSIATSRSSSSSISSIDSSAGSTYSSSSSTYAASDPFSFQSCMHLVARHSAFLCDWRSRNSNQNGAAARAGGSWHPAAAHQAR
jgi:hypothetical protein